MIKPIVMAGFTLYTKDGTINACLHRIGGPAIMGHGAEGHFVNGQLHNLNGPAITGSIEGIDPTSRYWIDGKPYQTEADYKEALMMRVLER